EDGRGARRITRGAGAVSCALVGCRQLGVPLLLITSRNVIYHSPMLIAQDELMCHQLPTTFDHVQQSDLRWTERVVIYGFDPATGTSVMTGMARSPNRNVTDAYAMVTVGGQAHVVRTSREISAGVEGIASWQIGPYTYRIT